MKTRTVTASLIVSLISGCGMAPVTPLTEKQMRPYVDVKALFKDKIPGSFSSKYSWLVYAELQRPLVYAKNYCDHQNGQLVKTSKEKPLDVHPGSSNYSGHYNASWNEINYSFGRFECRIHGRTDWAVNISHNGHKAAAGAFYSTVVKTAIYDSNDLRNQGRLKLLARQQAELAEQEKIKHEKKLREKRLLKEKERRDKEAERVQIALQEINNFRDNIQVATVTNCGPILEIRESLVKVYFTLQNYGNEHWINKNLVFPQGYGCNFYNGQYRPPAV